MAAKSKAVEAAQEAAHHHTTLNTFAAIEALLEHGMIYDSRANAAAQRILKIAKEERQRQLLRMDSALARVAAAGVAPSDGGQHAS